LIVKLTKWKDLAEFSEAFKRASGHLIPEEYFYFQNVWAVKEGDEITGGFAIVDYEMPRTLEEIPRPPVRINLCDKVLELTGYFCGNKKYIKDLKRRMATEVFKCKKDKFIYAYEISKTGLAEYYSIGYPVKLYEGVTKRGGEPQSIELLTKQGVLAIIAKTTLSGTKKGVPDET